MGFKKKPDASVLSISLDWLLPLPVRLRGLTHPVNFLVRPGKPRFSDARHLSAVISEPCNVLKRKNNHSPCPASSKIGSVAVTDFSHCDDKTKNRYSSSKASSTYPRNNNERWRRLCLSS